MAAADPPSNTAMPLLQAAVDHATTDHKRGQIPGKFTRSGGWRSASFIIGVEFAERFVFYGIGSNLISYMTGPLGLSTAASAASVNAWAGAACLLPLLGGVLADTFFGRYRTIIICSLIYILGLGLLSLTAVLPSLSLFNCHTSDEIASCSSHDLQVALFYISLYLIALALAGHKPCVQAFGADQFDESDPEECKAKSSFFNWCYFGLYTGTLVAYLVLIYIQDNLSWGLGFGIPFTVMAFALVIFMLGTKTYRNPTRNAENAIKRIGRVFVAAARNRQAAARKLAIEVEEAQVSIPAPDSHQFKFLNKALIVHEGFKEDWKVCTISELEEAKGLLRLVPIWLATLAYAIVIEQPSTFFTKQGMTLDRSIGANGFELPAASLQAIISVTIIIFVPIYDRVFVPWMMAFTRKPSGISMLQRIGIGMLFSICAMVTAALVEAKRIGIVREHGLTDMPKKTVPMSLWWLAPQYVLQGVSDVFTVVGLQEFFYDQVPIDLKSVGVSLFLSIFGVGGFLSSFLISIIQSATGGNGQHSWFADNINQAHLDYFYWLLSGLSALALVAYVYFAKSYVYNNGGNR